MIQLQHFPFNIAQSPSRSTSQKRKMQQRFRRPKAPPRKVCTLRTLTHPSAHIYLELVDLDWHTINPNEVYSRLSSSPSQGLSSEQVKRRLTEYGKNMPSPPPSHFFRKIFGYCFQGFGSTLLVGAILVFVAWKPLGQPPAQANLALAIVLVAVFVIQAAFNAWQDWSSSRVMASITTMLPDSCLILRDGARVTVIASDIVPGDILYIKSGNKLPADVRFVEISSDAKFDRSILTGEHLFITAVFYYSHILQANLYLYQAQSTAPTRIISRQDALACKVPTAYPAAVSVLLFLREIPQSLAGLQR